MSDCKGFVYLFLLLTYQGVLGSGGLDGVITQERTVGVIADESLGEDVWSSIPVVSTKLQECCNSRVVLGDERVKANINDVAEQLWLFDAGIVTMTGCDVTFLVGEAAETAGIQHIALPLSLCPVGHHHHSTTHFMTPKPGVIYDALIPLLQHVRGKRTHIIHDDTVSNDRNLQEFAVEVSKLGIYVTLHEFSTDSEIIITMLERIHTFNDGTTVNIVTFLGHDNLSELLQLASGSNTSWYPSRWLVCGQPVHFTDLDLVPWVKSNFVIVSTRVLDVEGTSGHYYNRTSKSFLGLALACFLAVELSYPGLLNSTHWLPRHDCKPPIMPTFASLQKQAAWIAYNREYVFDVNGYRQDVVIDVWGLTNTSEPQPPISSTMLEEIPTVRATWSVDKGMTFLEPRIFPYTFKDFGGEIFTIALYEALPFVIRHEDENGTVTYDGLCVSMLEEIAKRLHFRYILTEPPDGVYGSAVNKAKTEWNGMIKMVMEKEVPFAIGPFTVSEDRSRVVDFTTPFMEDMGGIAVKRPAISDTSAFQIWRPFSFKVWMAITVGIIIFGTLLYLVDLVTCYVSAEDATPTMPHSLVTYIWNIFGEYLEQSADYRPQPVSARCLVVFWWLFAIIMSSTYTANLAALYTVVAEPTHINSISELADSPTVQPLLQPGSFLNDMFKEAQPGTVYSKIAQRLADMPNMPVKSATALRMVAGSDQFAFMSDHSQLEYSASKSCQNLFMARDRFGTPWSFAFPVPKDSPYLPVLNEIILKFQESGLLDRWHQRWWTTSSACSPVGNKLPASIELPQFVGPFLMIVGAFMTTLCVLAIEVCIDRACKPKPKRPLTVFNG